MAGSVHDARVFRTSPIWQRINDGRIAIMDESHLIGDAAYPLSNYLLTPYRDTGALEGYQ